MLLLFKLILSLFLKDSLQDALLLLLHYGLIEEIEEGRFQAQGTLFHEFLPEFKEYAPFSIEIPPPRVIVAGDQETPEYVTESAGYDFYQEGFLPDQDQDDWRVIKSSPP